MRLSTSSRPSAASSPYRHEDTARRLRLRLAAVTAATVLVASPAGAQVTTFGADLGQAPNVAFDCSVWPVPLVGLVPSGAQSCTWATDIVPANLLHSAIVPGTGTVTQVRVRVGAPAGPMQVVVLRALREPGAAPGTNTVGCCTQVGQSDVFTPAANGITTLPVNLPVRNDPTPDENNIYAYDILALSILELGVPIPATDVGVHDPNGPGDLIDFPASGPNAAIQPTDTYGYALLMNADLVPTGAPSPTPPAGPPVTSGPPLRFASPMALVRANQALIDLTCALAAPCPGNLLLQNQPAPGATIIPLAATGERTAAGRRKGKRLVTYGGGSFTVPAGATDSVAVRLKAAGKKFKHAKKPASVWANITLTGTNPAELLTAQITIGR